METIEDVSASMIDLIMKGVYMGNIYHILLVYQEDKVVAWMALGIYLHDFHTQAWMRDFAILQETYSKPADKAYGNTAARAHLVMDRFLTLLEDMVNIRMELYEWQSAKTKSAS